MTWFRIASFALEEDLSRIHYFLEQRNIAHRFIEEDGRQVLLLEGQESSESVLAFIESWRKGEFELVEKQIESQSIRQSTWEKAGQNSPLTLSLIVLGILGFLLLWLDQSLNYTQWLTFQGFTIRGRSVQFYTLYDTLSRGEVWRLITPTFLHFGLLHIIFNGVMIWAFGRRLEIYLTREKYLALFLLTALGANITQYIFYEASIFGGLSGVVYGFIGYLWMRQRLAPQPILAVPQGIMAFLIFWLVLGFLGIIDQIMAGKVANGAHLGGLVMGVLSAYFIGNDRKG